MSKGYLHAGWNGVRGIVVILGLLVLQAGHKIKTGLER